MKRDLLTACGLGMSRIKQRQKHHLLVRLLLGCCSVYTRLANARDLSFLQISNTREFFDWYYQLYEAVISRNLAKIIHACYLTTKCSRYQIFNRNPRWLEWIYSYYSYIMSSSSKDNSQISDVSAIGNWNRRLFAVCRRLVSHLAGIRLAPASKPPAYSALYGHKDNVKQLLTPLRCIYMPFRQYLLLNDSFIWRSPRGTKRSVTAIGLPEITERAFWLLEWNRPTVLCPFFHCIFVVIISEVRKIDES